MSIFPHFIVVKVLVSILRVTKRETEAVFSQVEVFINIDNQLKGTLEFFLDLFRSDKEVTVVERHFTHTLKTSEGTRFLVTVHHTDFSDTDWQFTVRVNMVFVDLDVVWAVHWTKNKFFPVTHIHSWEHVFLVMIPVTRSLVKLYRSKWWSVDVLVARSQLFIDNVAFQFTTDSRTIWQPEWQTLSYFL
ncbi:hypothetical protein SORDD16_01301 [Streptococcus oralis]|uniref:Uncharacterized protein n=1 Tax=Streptococcus oralis TaxID=1303 RepID=A0A139PC07_STROR|nr:hypothetical protein SORDD16_01301 [Streptococcus oralis]